MTKTLLYLFSLCLSILFITSCNQEQKVDEEQKEIEVADDFIMPPLPEEVTFADQEIKLDNFDLRERLDKELIVNTFFHSSTIQGFKRANRYFGEIEKILKSEGIPDDFKYLCLIESGLTQATSPSGAKGFWQFMSATGKEYDLLINDEIDERLSIVKSTYAACEYLKDANEIFDDWILTAASYNRGIGGIQSELDEQGVESYFDLYLNSETSRYVFRILALKHIFENAEEYGFDQEDMELYEPIKTRSVSVSKPIPDLAMWAIQNGSNLRMVKVLNPWLKKNKLTKVSNGLEILLPLK
jgi:hypothetical protein